MVKLLLEAFDVPYIPVASLAMQERVRLIQRILDLSGIERLEKTVELVPHLRPVERNGEKAHEAPMLVN